MKQVSFDPSVTEAPKKKKKKKKVGVRTTPTPTKTGNPAPASAPSPALAPAPAPAPAYSADQAANKELARRAATVPKFPASLLADIRGNTAEVFDDFELQVCGVHEALWFQAFVGAMPKGLLTTEQLQKIRQDNKDDTDQYPALKSLILETYVNINAHQQARKKFEALKMSADYGVREFAQRILSQRSICDALPKSDVNDATQRDVFLKGLPSQLTERVLQKKKSRNCSFDKLVEISHKYWISLTEAGVLKSSNTKTASNLVMKVDGDELDLSNGIDMSNKQFLSSMSKSVQSMSSGDQNKLKQLLFIKRGSKRDAAKVPKFEGDRSNFVKALKAKYDDDIWSERIALMESGKKITKVNDNLFELDKSDDGKYVCVKCWKLKHTASRCTSSNKKKAKSDK